MKEIKELYERNKTWVWVFGQSTDFTNSIETKFPWALVEVNFTVVNGIVKSGQIFSDCLDSDFVSKLNSELKDFQYSQEGFKDFI